MFHFFDDLNSKIYYWLFPLLFIIPLNIFIVGDKLGIGIQWVFLRYLDTGYGISYGHFLKPFEYVMNGTITGKTAVSEMILLFSIILFIVSFVLLQKPVYGDLSLPGLIMIIGGILVLIADILQTSITFSGPAGLYIPIGVPFILLLGYLMYQSKSELTLEKNLHTVFWKVLYFTMMILVIFGNLAVISNLKNDPIFFVDFNTYSGALDSLDHGEDPYNVTNVVYYSKIASPFGFAYPPFTLMLFQVISFFAPVFHSIDLYLLVLLLMILIATIILIKTDLNPDYFLLVFLIITAFSGTYWNFLTGNFALLYLVLSSLFFYFIYKGRFVLSAIVMGFFAAFSLFPIIFNGIYLAIKRPFREVAEYLFISLGVTSAILVSSYCLNPPLFLSFINHLSGNMSPAYEVGGIYTPGPYSFISGLLNFLNFHSSLAIVVAFLVYIGTILLVTSLYLKKNPQNVLVTSSLIFLSIFLLMPRVKPYYFTMLIVPVYFLLKDASVRTKCIGLSIVSLFPAIWFFVKPGLQNSFLILIYQYCQIISLFIFFLFICQSQCQEEKDII